MSKKNKNNMQKLHSELKAERAKYVKTDEAADLLALQVVELENRIKAVKVTVKLAYDNLLQLFLSEVDAHGQTKEKLVDRK
jgi:hypothetical protein